MKTHSSFRLPEKTRQNLQDLSKKYELSQAELIEIMSDFVNKSELESDFMISVKAFKNEKNPAFRKFKAEYEKLSLPEQKIMRQKLERDE